MRKLRQPDEFAVGLGFRDFAVDPRDGSVLDGDFLRIVAGVLRAMFVPREPAGIDRKRDVVR
jgi:hypothetical protein